MTFNTEYNFFTNEGVDESKSYPGSQVYLDEQFGMKVKGINAASSASLQASLPYDSQELGGDMPQYSTLSRSDVLNQVSGILQNADYQKTPYSKLVENIKGADGKLTPYRIGSPSSLSGDDAAFSKYYNTYLAELMQHVKSNSFYINLDSVADSRHCLIKATEVEDPSTGKLTLEFNAVDLNGKVKSDCSVKNKDGSVSNLPANYTNANALTSSALVQSVTPASENTVEKAIFRAIYSAETADLLPNCSHPYDETNPLSQFTLDADMGSYYQDNAYDACMSNVGGRYQKKIPLYNLYSKAMQQFSNVYSYTFGDFLGLDGTILNNQASQPITLEIGSVS